MCAMNPGHISKTPHFGRWVSVDVFVIQGQQDVCVGESAVLQTMTNVLNHLRIEKIDVAKAADILSVIVAQKLPKERVDEVPPSKSIEDLVGRGSPLQNDIISAPKTGEEPPFEELGASLSSGFGGPLDKHSTGLVSRLIGAAGGGGGGTIDSEELPKFQTDQKKFATHTVYSEAVREGVRKLEAYVEEMASGDTVSGAISIEKIQDDVLTPWIVVKSQRDTPTCAQVLRLKVYLQALVSLPLPALDLACDVHLCHRQMLCN
ncbi:hypothetical protein BD779DRAFT_1478443 [Infundibulicybe gibba]|nr:hypothetical protein BD779DRAFT_1478443 [Infundibulicybe gibba]